MHQTSKLIPKFNFSITAAVIFSQMEATYEEAARLIPSSSSQTISRGNILGRWGRRISTTPTAGSSDLPVPVHPGAPSMMITALPISCKRCEDLETQSDINRKMLNDCLTDLKIKETEADAVKDLVKSLQARLDHAQFELELEQARSKHELGSKDEEVLYQIAQSKLHSDTSNELAAQLTKQQKEFTEGLASLTAGHERELGAKDQEIVSLQGKLEKQEFVEGTIKAELYGKITDLEANLRSLRLGIEGKASAYAAELQRQFERRFNDDLRDSRARILALESDNQKMYAQLSVEDVLSEDELSEEEAFENGVTL